MDRRLDLKRRFLFEFYSYLESLQISLGFSVPYLVRPLFEYYSYEEIFARCEVMVTEIIDHLRK
jgi:hypothetical protein